MKIKDCFKEKKIFGQYILTPYGVRANSVAGPIRLNQSGYDIWCWIKEGLEEEEIAKKYGEKYNFDEKKAYNDVHSLIQQFYNVGAMDGDIDWQHENLKDIK